MDNEVDTFSKACAKYLASTGKSVLSIEDKREISRLICKNRLSNATTTQPSSSSSHHNKNFKITVISAYSDNYAIGKLCQQVNSIYCGIHGYEFICHVLPQVDMETIIAPRSHCTWYKVKMIIDLLTSKLSDSNTSTTSYEDSEYLFWIDSDAIVIDHSQTAESFVERGQRKDLIIAEDMNPCCLVNAGVMMIKVSSWSLSLWTDIWLCTQYFQRPFYEQAALLKCLKLRQEGLHLFTPFHTYLPGAMAGDKFFQHIAVFPSIDFNTNRGFISDKPKVRRKFNRSSEKLKRREREFAAQNNESHDKIDELSKLLVVPCKDIGSSSCSSDGSVAVTSDITQPPSVSEVERNDRPRFIYHAAGRCDKLVSLVAVAQMYGFPVDASMK